MQPNIVTSTPEHTANTARRVIKNTRGTRMGYLVFNGQPSGVPCGVREFSAEGAVLTMNGWMGVPDAFTLFIEPDSVKVDCKVMRKRGSKVQVSFMTWENDVRYRTR
ncbi:MAG: hypothetical protein QM488_15730 [Rhizobiaceae bacterium]